MNRTIVSHKTSLLGQRDDNEDVERIRMNLSPEGKANDPKYAPIDFFVICDGHGGKSVAQFVAPKLEKYFISRHNDFPIAQKKIANIYEHIQKELINSGIANHCGCTALVVIRYLDKYGKENIQVINIGDCRAVLSKKGLALPLSKDHKPIWPDEKRRIDNVNRRHRTNKEIHYEAGDWRIGDLSVSRSFGDLDNTPHVSHVPDVYNYQLQDDDEFIVLACDGVWDVLENHEVVNFVRDHIKNKPDHLSFYKIPGRYPSMEVNETENIARKLASYAIARGSSDNVSVITVFL
ncbi:putative protein phosphatase 2c [Cotonvirus japonicus]|uniref:PPM-type phosphatase domain-containing protein n=1 Tax=Cotonvirus japonicus TaxID=2811091 RepID=A0ABM7NSZ5_9VIRU|nr:putative protein phosphatase 2c [Cotonvirus japonicus]BCS83285.1 putative protein phosphatase 2c [Cotonvirus japonicus]